MTRHSHIQNRFRKLPIAHTTDDGDYTDYCLNCDSPTGYRYEDICSEGCDVEITECAECGVFRELPV